MIRYWDYSEKERAELTQEQVQSMLTVEMMENGALDPGPCPKVEVETAPELPKKTYYKVKRNSYQEFDAVFRTNEDAVAFLKLNPMCSNYDYQISHKYTYTEPVEEPAIAQVEMYDKDDVKRQGATLKRIYAANEANKKAIEAHEAAQKKASAITDGVWNDWNDCKATARSHRRLVETFEKYTALADGNREMARKFLSKAFPEPEIVAAFAWCDIPDPAQEAAHAATPQD